MMSINNAVSVCLLEWRSDFFDSFCDMQANSENIEISNGAEPATAQYMDSAIVRLRSKEMANRRFEAYRAPSVAET